jgi:hypothetical protein
MTVPIHTAVRTTGSAQSASTSARLLAQMQTSTTSRRTLPKYADARIGSR